jgi:hypothetical protein
MLLHLFGIHSQVVEDRVTCCRTAREASRQNCVLTAQKRTYNTLRNDTPVPRICKFPAQGHILQCDFLCAVHDHCNPVIFLHTVRSHGRAA